MMVVDGVVCVDAMIMEDLFEHLVKRRSAFYGVKQ